MLLRVIHVTRVMSPTPVLLMIFFLGVMRVMHVMRVIRVMTYTPLSPRIFGFSVMRVMYAMHVMRVRINHPFPHICLFCVLFMLCVLRVLFIRVMRPTLYILYS